MPSADSTISASPPCQISTRQRLAYLIPIACFGVAQVINFAVIGRRMIIPWGYYQLLDRDLLARHLGESLLLLHNQPPLLNTLLGFILKLARATGTSPESWAEALFAIVGLATFLLLFYVARRWTGSVALATAACLLQLAEPAYYAGGTGQSLFFYEFPLQAVLLALLACADRLSESRSWRWGAAAVLAVAIAVNTRSIFHPIVFGIGMLLWLLVVPSPCHWRATAGLLAVELVLLLAWPAKNFMLTGAFTSNTLDAYNLTRGFTEPPAVLKAYLSNGTPPPSIDVRSRFPVLRNWSDKDLRPITATTKADGSRNWNHWLVLTTRSETLAAALDARKHQSLLKTAAEMYWLTMRGMYLHPYWLKAFGHERTDFDGYLWLYDRTLYAEFGDTPESPRPLFGLVILPALVIAAVVRLLLVRQNRRLFLMLCFLTAFPLAVIVASDGYEGNRMRYSVYPLMVLMAVVMIGDIAAYFRRRRQSSALA